MSGEDLDRRPEFKTFVRQHDERCLVLSPALCQDGQVMALQEAVEHAVMCPDAVLILGSTFAVVLGEVMKGGRGKYLLLEQR